MVLGLISVIGACDAPKYSRRKSLEGRIPSSLSDLIRRMTVDGVTPERDASCVPQERDIGP